MKFEEPTPENNYKDEKAEMKRAIEIMYHNSELMKAWIRRARDLVPKEILAKIEAGNETRVKTNEEKALELARGLILHAYEGWIRQTPWIDKEYWLERYGTFIQLLCPHCEKETGNEPDEKCKRCGGELYETVGHICTGLKVTDEK